MLLMSNDAYAEIIGHALAGLPNEACGLLAIPKDSDRVTRFFPVRNAAESSRIYRLDDTEYLEVERTADAEGFSLVAVMHSHTHTTAYPSPTDVQDAAAFDPFGALRYVIVSLKDPEPALRCYQILDGTITEESVTVEG